MAPEIIRHEKYSMPADVYSFGVVLWQLVTRQKPYNTLTPIQTAFGVAKEGLRPHIPSKCPPLISDLMQLCWSEEPHKRPPFARIVTMLKNKRLINYGEGNIPAPYVTYGYNEYEYSNIITENRGMGLFQSQI